MESKSYHFIRITPFHIKFERPFEPIFMVY